MSISIWYIVFFCVFPLCLFYRHNLPDRMRKGEDVFYFCFYLLPYLAGVEFSYPFLSGIHHANDVPLRRTPGPYGSDGCGGGGGEDDLRQSEMSSTSSAAPIPVMAADAAVPTDTTVCVVSHIICQGCYFLFF